VFGMLWSGKEKSEPGSWQGLSELCLEMIKINKAFVTRKVFSFHLNDFLS
jgi:hypothetical protein